MHFRPKVTAYRTWASHSAQRRRVYKMISYDIEFEGQQLTYCSIYYIIIVILDLKYVEIDTKISLTERLTQPKI